MAVRIEGNDISVENPAATTQAQTGWGVWVGNGSIVTVHSGQARLTIADNSKIDICGPAKFTFLETGGAITIALDFGRLRVTLPTELSLQIYTPFVTATPLTIGGGTRDFTLGLDLNGTICMQAAEGAIRLQQQFTGEDLVIPQGGEFFIGGGLLVPTTGTPGSCRCDVSLSRVNPTQAPTTPDAGLAAPPVATVSKPTAQGKEAAKDGIAGEESNPIESPMTAALAENNSNTKPLPLKADGDQTVELSVPAKANPAAPVAPAAKQEATATPPSVDPPIWKVVMPPLGFSADSPYPPPNPSPETILLVRESRVQPEWVFDGRVELPRVASAEEKAQPVFIAEKGPSRKPGFWTKLKRFLSGSLAECEGAGCVE